MEIPQKSSNGSTIYCEEIQVAPEIEVISVIDTNLNESTQGLLQMGSRHIFALC